MTEPTPEELGNPPQVSSTEHTLRLYRAVSIIGEALERRRRKIAAGIPVEPPVYCPCAECRYEKPEPAN